jgi:amino acid adenylation domain-containing protein
MQQGMLFHTLYDPESAPYFEQFSCVIEGEVDLKMFDDAWNHLVDSYPIFRTVFNWKDTGKPVQIVLKKRPITLEILDLKHLEKAAQEMWIDDFMNDDKKIGFDLAKGPMMRLFMFELAKCKYFFLWSYHHILLDGWCLQPILTDFFTSYMSLAKGQVLPRLPRPSYREYISWLARQDKDKAQAFWKQYLKGFDATTPLMYDNPRTNEISVREKQIEVTDELSARIEEFARSQRTTQSAFIQSIWAVLLYRYSGLNDLVFGLTVSGRPATLKGSDAIIGLCINTLPVRAVIEPMQSYKDFLGKFKESTASVMDYEYSFLPDIKVCSAVPASENLFNSLVVFENYPMEKDIFDIGTDIKVSEFKAREATNFDITLVALPRKNLKLIFSYNAEKFEDETIQRMMGHFSSIIEDVLADPGKAIENIKILSSNEEHQLLNEFNDTAAGYPGEITIHGLFEEQVLKTPDNIAAVFEDSSITYFKLNEKANQLAYLLRSKGVGRQSIVAMVLNKSLDMIVSIMAILKSGAAYLPIDPDYPADRIEFMLEDSNAAVLLTTRDLQTRVLFKRERIFIDEMDVFNGKSDNPENINSPLDMAYIIYTSGTTGKPKGVIIEHRNIVRLLFNDKNLFDFNEKDVWTMFHSYCFDFSVWEMYGALLSGGKLIVVPKAVSRDPERYLEILKKHKVTILNQTPSAFYNLSDEEMKHESKELNIREIIFGGEALKPVKCRQWAQKYPETKLINMYGITETTVHVTYKGITFKEIDANISNIGKPIPTLYTYIMDRNSRLLPIGVPGELCVGGDGVGRGYLNRPELTKEKFTDNPYMPGERIYHSGDLAKMLINGEMEYLGRIDHQIQLRGFRVELGEVESALTKVVGISDSAVIDKDDASGGKYLIAYYVSEKEIPVSDIRAMLGEFLPDYMIPTRFMHLDALPLTPNGKVDRKALPDLEAYRPEMASEYVEPGNDTERMLADVFKEILNLDRVGVQDNYFDLGGDSIISLQVVAKLKKLGYELKPKDIFEHQTIAELSHVIKKITLREEAQGPVEGEAPLTPIQQWFFGIGLKNVNLHNQALMFRTDMKLDDDALEKAFQAVIDYHDALRMRFVEDHQVQENLPAGQAVSFTAADVAGEDELVKEVIKLQSQINITDSPVFAAGLFKSGGTSYIVVAAHHLAVDAVSWRFIIEDLFSAYSAILSEKPVELPAKTTPFIEFSKRLTDYAQKETVKKESFFWANELKGCAASIPVDHDRGPNCMGSTGVANIEFDSDYTLKIIRDAHKAYNTEVNDLILCALMRSFTSWTKEPGIVIDMEGHGREDMIEGIDISRTTGWFTTIYPVVLRINSSEALSAQVKGVKEKLRSIPAKGFNYGVLKYIRRMQTLLFRRW